MLTFCITCKRKFNSQPTGLGGYYRKCNWCRVKAGQDKVPVHDVYEKITNPNNYNKRLQDGMEMIHANEQEY